MVVGGFATVLHGHARLTADIDLVIDLVPAEARKTMEALTRLGFRPRAPVDPLAFADPAIRQEWIRDKGMRVFSLWDPSKAIPDLVHLKRLAGRPQDLADIEALELILRRRENPMSGDGGRETPRDDWGVGWEAHRIHQLTLALRATPAQRLAWLEEAIMLAHRAGALPRRRDSTLRDDRTTR